jgi:hypothetical protein
MSISPCSYLYCPSPVDVIHYTQDKLAIIGANTDVIWVRTLPREPVAARSDGWWGPHEYAVLPQTFDRSSPYLAWIPSLTAYEDPDFSRHTGLNPSLALLSFVRFPLREPSSRATHSGSHEKLRDIPGLPSRPQALQPSKVDLSFVSTSDEMRSLVKEQVFALRSAVQKAISVLEEYAALSYVRIPQQALFRLEQAYYWNLLPGTVTESGHILILSGIKRATYELHGFLLWLRDITASMESPDSLEDFSKPYKTRGVFVDNAIDYNTISRYGVAVYMEVSSMSITPHRSTREVPLSPIPITRQLLVPHGLRASHHTYIYFYPPLVERLELFELAARGYASRLDHYEPNKDIDKLHAKMVNDTSK